MILFLVILALVFAFAFIGGAGTMVMVSLFVCSSQQSRLEEKRQLLTH
jgi:hypothetical protein